MVAHCVRSYGHISSLGLGGQRDWDPTMPFKHNPNDPRSCVLKVPPPPKVSTLQTKSLHVNLWETLNIKPQKSLFSTQQRNLVSFSLCPWHLWDYFSACLSLNHEFFDVKETQLVVSIMGLEDGRFDEQMSE